jgi:hypothetical protein
MNLVNDDDDPAEGAPLARRTVDDAASMRAMADTTGLAILAALMGRREDLPPAGGSAPDQGGCHPHGVGHRGRRRRARHDRGRHDRGGDRPAPPRLKRGSGKTAELLDPDEVATELDSPAVVTSGHNLRHSLLVRNLTDRQLRSSQVQGT